jgi:hypothetical protein
MFDGELVFWCVACVMAIIGALVVFPMLSNYIAYKDTEKMFAER